MLASVPALCLALSLQRVGVALLPLQLRRAPDDEARLREASRLVQRADNLTRWCEATLRVSQPRVGAYERRDARLQPFVVVARQRSGSTWLDVVLNGQPCVTCGHEKFIGSSKNEQYVFTTAARRAAFLKFLEALGLRRPGDASLDAACQSCVGL